MQSAADEVVIGSGPVGAIANQLIQAGVNRADAIEDAFDTLLERDGRFVRTGEVFFGAVTSFAMCVEA